MNFQCWLAVFLCACGVAVAQQVPNIDDVYAEDQVPAVARFGPDSDPNDLVDRYVEQLRVCDRLDDAVSVADVSATEGESVTAQGTVAIGRIPGGDLDRFRFDIVVTLPGAEPRDLTLGSTGRGYYVIDRTERTVDEFDDLDDSHPLGKLARQLLISDLLTDGVPVMDSGSAVAGGNAPVHFVDRAFGEHLYVRFSELDGLPRLVERVFQEGPERPTILRVRFTDLRITDAKSKESFEMIVPEGFSKSSGTQPADP